MKNGVVSKSWASITSIALLPHNSVLYTQLNIYQNAVMSITSNKFESEHVPVHPGGVPIGHRKRVLLATPGGTVLATPGCNLMATPGGTLMATPGCNLMATPGGTLMAGGF